MNYIPGSDSRPVAFFDFDGTLTTGDTLMPFLKFVVGKPTYYAKLALLGPVLGAYFAKLLRNDIAKQIVLKKYLAGYQIEDLFSLGERFSDEVIPGMLREEGMKLLRWHQEQGHVCVVVSASMDVYLSSWARNNGIDFLISSRLLRGSEGMVDGTLEAKNCFGEEKAYRIKAWLEPRSPTHTYGYGDTKGDFDMLRLVMEPKILNRGKFIAFDH